MCAYARCLRLRMQTLIKVILRMSVILTTTKSIMPQQQTMGAMITTARRAPASWKCVVIELILHAQLLLDPA